MEINGEYLIVMCILIIFVISVVGIVSKNNSAGVVVNNNVYASRPESTQLDITGPAKSSFTEVKATMPSAVVSLDGMIDQATADSKTGAKNVFSSNDMFDKSMLSAAMWRMRHIAKFR